MGRLKKSLCGTRDAPELWQKELVSTLKDLRFKDSRLHPGFFYNQGREIALVSHVDDLLVGGTLEDLVWVWNSIDKNYDIEGTDIENARMDFSFWADALSVMRVATCGVLTQSTAKSS